MLVFGDRRAGKFRRSRIKARFAADSDIRNRETEGSPMKRRVSAALLALLLTLGPGAALAQEALPGLIRLHVIAASDSEADQAEKLLARDAVLACAEELLDGCESCAEAYRVLDERLADVEAAARQALPGRDVRAALTEERYPERLYGSVRVPAGEYTSLQVIVGAGAGHNWWCVVYPSLCALAEEAPEAELVEDAPAPQGFWARLLAFFTGERDSRA